MNSTAPARPGSPLVLPTFVSAVELRTRRTLLRGWVDDDLEPWAEMNADPQVRQWFVAVHEREQALAEARVMRSHLQRRGWGMWALEIPGQWTFAGFVGLHVPGFDAPFMPAVEIGWRLRRSAWGQGLATEAAAAAAAFAFDHRGLRELVAYTAPGNAASRRVMHRLGMVHDASADFDHPRIPAEHALRRQALYRLAPAALVLPM